MKKRAVVILYTGDELVSTKQAQLATYLAGTVDLDPSDIQIVTYDDDAIVDLIVKDSVSPAISNEDTVAAQNAAIYVGQMFARYLQKSAIDISGFSIAFVKELCRCEDDKLKNAMEIIATKSQYIPLECIKKYNITPEVILYIQTVYSQNIF